jgi:hypothetical protein
LAFRKGQLNYAHNLCPNSSERIFQSTGHLAELKKSTERYAFLCFIALCSQTPKYLNKCYHCFLSEIIIALLGKKVLSSTIMFFTIQLIEPFHSRFISELNKLECALENLAC